jgi:uncharacterized repeat protein (TIGR03943 family)
VGFLWLLDAQRYQRFIAPELWPLPAGALVLCAAFLAATCFRLRHAAMHPTSTLTRWSQVALLLLPLVYMAGASATGLGSAAFATRRTGGDVALRPMAPRPGPRGEVELLDLLMNFEHYAGQRVIVDGMVYHDADLPADSSVVFRFVLTCCAADAIPAAVLVQSADIKPLEADAWVRVTGVPRLTRLDGEEAPAITAERVERIEPPRNPYLSPW